MIEVQAVKPAEAQPSAPDHTVQHPLLAGCFQGNTQGGRGWAAKTSIMGFLRVPCPEVTLPLAGTMANGLKTAYEHISVNVPSTPYPTGG